MAFLEGDLFELFCHECISIEVVSKTAPAMMNNFNKKMRP